MEHAREQRVKRTQRDYSFAFKMMVVHEVEKGQITYKQAQAKYGIQGRSTVLVWLRKHGQQDWTSNMPTSSKRQLTPQQRIRQLEKQLAAEKLKTEFIQDVIYHIDKECGTDLGKSIPSTFQRLAKPKKTKRFTLLSVVRNHSTSLLSSRKTCSNDCTSNRTNTRVGYGVSLSHAKYRNT